MKEIKCPKCTQWYEVDPVRDKYSYTCSVCQAPYKVKTKVELKREEEMKAPVSKPPLTWKHRRATLADPAFGEIEQFQNHRPPNA